MSDMINVIDWQGAKRMPLDEFVHLSWPESRARLIDKFADKLVDGIVCYVNEDGGSADYGMRYFVYFGPGPACSPLPLERLLSVKYQGAGAIAYCEKEVKTT